MTETAGDFSNLVGLVGLILVLILLIKSGCSRLGLPPLVGYLGLGFLLSLADHQTVRYLLGRWPRTPKKVAG